MTTLRLRIHKHLDDNERRPPVVPVKILLVRGGGARASRTTRTETAMIAVSHRAEDGSSIDVEPGHYYVETVLPSGEILADDVEVTVGGANSLVLNAEPASSVWLEWQSFAGNTLAIAPQAPLGLLARGHAAPRTAARARKAKRKLRARPKEPGTTRRSPGAHIEMVIPAVAAPADAGDVALGAPLQWLRQWPRGGEPNAIDRALGWTDLARLAEPSKGSCLVRLNAGTEPEDVPAFRRDASAAVYRLTTAHIAGAEAIDRQYRERYLVAIPRRRVVELLNLPMPWRDIHTGREVIVEVAVRPVTPDLFSATTTVRDPDWGALVSYLSAGSLPTVKEIFEKARGYLYHKTSNPLAAAAGGYALVGTALTTRAEAWHKWIWNLMHLDESIPDGAILWAQLKLRTRRKPRDVAAAAEALKSAYHRGLPYYSMGIKWLMEGLEQVERNDPEAARMLANVREIAWRTNYQQAFTGLKFSGPTDVRD